MRVRLAVVQLSADHGAEPAGRAAARAEAVRAVREAAAEGARLVVLPEYASGWEARLVPALAEPDDGPFLAALREVATACGVTVVAGVVLPTAQEGRALNVTVVVGPDGAELGRYAKVHRYDAFGARESDLLDAGDPARPLVLDVPCGDASLRLGVVTCYDLRFPESVRALLDLADGAAPPARAGEAAAATEPPRPPDVVAVGAAWASGPGKVEQLSVLTRARAIETTAYLALASQGGHGRVGASAVVDPTGAVLVSAVGEDDGAPSDTRVLTADVDLAQLRAVRERVPVLAHRRYRVVPAERATD